MGSKCEMSRASHQVSTGIFPGTHVKPGDVLLNITGASIGRVCAVPEDFVEGNVSQHVCIVRPDKSRLLPRLLAAYLSTPMMQREVQIEQRGASREGLTLQSIRNFRVILPPLPEQTTIAHYLDHVDRRIQRYIQAKQKRITLLHEARQAIIHRAVTRGLDPDVPLKPSSVDWLGDIPAHWEVRRLRYLIEGNLTYGANAAAEYDNPNWPRYLRITDFALDGTLREDTFRSLPPEIAKDYLVEPGDLLLARSGATVGKAFLVTSETSQACHAGYLIRARPRRSLIEPKFLFAFTQSPCFMRWKDSTFIIATIQNI